MIITLGILSLFQLTLLPGLITSRLMKIQGTGNIILVSITFSPIINYLFVFTTTAIGVYTRPVTLLFFGFELIALIYLMNPLFSITLGQAIDTKKTTLFFREYLNTQNKNSSWHDTLLKIFRVTLLALAVFSIIYAITSYLSLKISVFTAWDAVVSWDRWAINWYNNIFPIKTWHYPQLIPANLSLTYQFIGNSQVKFFAKQFMGLIEVYIPITIFILGVAKRETGYFFGVILATWLQSLLGSQGNGYVDSSVAFFALATIAYILLSETKINSDKNNHILIGAIIAAGAAVTKQTGLWISLTYPLLILLTRKKKEDRRRIYQLIPNIIVIYMLIILPWYGYKEYQIQIGNDSSELNTLTSLGQQDRNWDEQLEYSFDLLKATSDNIIISGQVTIVLLICLLLFASTNRFYRHLITLIIIPFALIWSLLFSYDTRNFNLIVPLIGLSAGIGLQKIIDKISFFTTQQTTKKDIITDKPKEHAAYFSQNKRFRSVKVIYFLAPIVAIFLLPLRYPDTYIINRSIDLQKEIGNKVLNQKLYQYQSKYGFNGKILTDYQYLPFLPGLEEYAKISFSAYPATFLKDIEEEEVAYVLLNPDWMAPEVASYVTQNIDSGNMRVLFKHGNQGEYLFITTCRGPCDNR